MQNTNSDTILDRAIRVMDYIAGHKEACRFSTLLDHFSFNRATLAKILKILTAYQMLERTASGYTIGPRPAILAGGSNSQMDLIAKCRPWMESLSAQNGVTVLLLRVLEDQSICLHKVMHEHAPAMRSVGSVLAEKFIHPWSLLHFYYEHEIPRHKIEDSIRKDAEKAGYVQAEPDLSRLHEIVRILDEGVGDDFGLFIPHTRRLAVPLKCNSEDSANAFLAVGFFANTKHDVTALKTAMKEAAKAINNG